MSDLSIGTPFKPILGKGKARERGRKAAREGANRNTKPVSIDPARILPYSCIRPEPHGTYFTRYRCAH